MSETSIIILNILLLLAIIIGMVFLIFSGFSFLFRKIEKSYQRFLNDKENFSDKNLKKLQTNLHTALGQLCIMIATEKDFIENNSDSEFSKSAADIPDAQRFLSQNEKLEIKFRQMQKEVERELARREHFRKYK